MEHISGWCWQEFLKKKLVWHMYLQATPPIRLTSYCMRYWSWSVVSGLCMTDLMIWGTSWMQSRSLLQWLNLGCETRWSRNRILYLEILSTCLKLIWNNSYFSSQPFQWVTKLLRYTTHFGYFISGMLSMQHSVAWVWFSVSLTLAATVQSRSVNI